MATQSRGYQHYTTYESEGEQARVIGHFMREQTEAGIMRRTPFTLRFWGYGGGTRIHVRAVSIAPGQVVGVRSRIVPAGGTAVHPAAAELIAAALDDLPIAAASSPEGSASPTSTARAAEPVSPRGFGIREPFGDGGPVIGPIDPLPDGGGGGGGGFLHAAVTVELFAPGDDDPVERWELPEEIAGNYRELTFNPPGLPTPDAPVRRTGWWRVTVSPVGPDPALIRIDAHSTMTRVPFRRRVMTTRLFDHLFRVALEALVPRAVIEGRTLKVGMGKDLARALGISPALHEQDIHPIISWAKLTSLDITAVNGRKLKEIARDRRRTPAGLARVKDDDITLRIQAAFYNASATVYGFDVARLDGEFGELLLSFNRSLTELTPAAFLDVRFSSLAGFLVDLASLFSEVDRDIVNTTIESSIRSYEQHIRKYFRYVLGRAMGQRAVLHDVRSVANGWEIRYFDEPVLPPENTRWRRPIDDVVGPALGGTIGMAMEGGSGTAAEPVDDDPTRPPTGNPLPPPPTDPPGVIPPEFEMEGGVALERLDRHQSIVVIMMENRSYDHLLGGLARARPRVEGGYDGPPSGATNASAGGLLDGVRLVNARDIGMGTAIPVSPGHHFHEVLFQIGDGTEAGAGSGDMMGFARDVAGRTDSPQLAMTMYGEADLPVYYRLTNEFCTCDRWFCAHPGPTWPNRFATLMGRIPELDNFAVDDPQIGFLPHETIFDTLSRAGIDWKVFESDLSIVRMFDRFRLDDRHVVPIGDKDDGLDATLRKPGALPRVMFVEPNFADLPPLATANDDHPPADLRAGQEFIKGVCDAIWSAGRFRECLVVITYDEHGGFYDHVPPPGTPKAEPTPVGPRSRLHPDGPEHLGVRVPAIVMSPYVSHGKVDRTIFDHTSILKTILVHNRARLQGSVLGSFGPRVNAAAHLGQVLDLSSPRQAPQAFDPRRGAPPTEGGRGETGPRPTEGATERAAERAIERATERVLDTATEATTASAAGIPPRTVVIAPRTASFVDEPEGPRDYHAALKQALAPRQWMPPHPDEQ